MIFKEGDKKEMFCKQCEAFSQGTFRTRDVPVTDHKTLVKNILVGVCDDCNTVILIPSQSLPAIRESRNG